MMTFIGLDLAWSPRNPSGAAVIVGDATGGRLVDAQVLDTNESIVAYVSRHAAAGPAIVAVDAPLKVPNQTGRRPGEAELGRVFARYQAGAHPANRQRLAFDGAVRGEAIVEALEVMGFTHDSVIRAGQRVRQVIEVYPHAAMIGLFGLARTLKYKVRQGRTRDDRLAAWGAYRRRLRALSKVDPSLRGHERLLARRIAGLRGRRLKDYEDTVDAVLCAYIALYGFRWGEARCRTYGNMAGGYIFTPVPPSHR
jgi:predicted RNase H-like nuclease